MAARPTILLIGDETLRGKRVISELEAIDPALSETIEDAWIWDPTPGVWELVKPGVNTDPLGSGTSFWCVESLLRRDLDAVYAPGTNVWFVKHTLQSQLSPDTRAVPTWTEGDNLTCLLDLVFAQLAAAHAAAVTAGDTLVLAGVVISIQQLDPLASTWRAYGELMRALIDRIRGVSLPITAGTLRGDGQRTPVVLIEPHYGYGSLAWNYRMRMVQCRMQIQQLACEPDRIAVARTHQLTSSDNATFSATSMVELSKRVARALRAPAAIADVSTPEAHLTLWVSDSICDGTAPNGLLASHLQGALTGANIWSPYAGAFATMQAGVNNTNSFPTTENGMPPASFQLHGPEIYVADYFRTAFGTSYTVKGAVANTFATANQQATSIELAPTLDRLLHTWSPGARGQMFDLAVRGWFRSSLDWLRNTSKKPVLDLVVICVGTNDLLAFCTPEAVPAAVLDLVQSIRRVCTQDNVSTVATKFVILIPSANLPTQGADLDGMRAGLKALQETQLSDARFIDLTDYAALTLDGTHLNAAGTAALGQAIIDAYRFLPEEPAVVAPLFVPTKADLRKALRMSKISDDSDALNMIDTAIQTVSVLFYRTLGPARIAALQAIAYPNSPSSDTEYLRVLAATTEIKAVRAQLMRTIPTMFMDGSVAEKTWQEEAGFRYNPGHLAMRDELKRLDTEIQEALGQLASMQLAAGGGISLSIVSPASTISPGESINAISF